MVPKHVLTIWLNDDPVIPDHVVRWISTHQSVRGCTHHLMTLENYPKGIPYVERFIASKQWARAADYLRIHYLHEQGGMYLDADVEVRLPFFEDLFTLLKERDKPQLLCEREPNGFIANSFIMADAGHPMLKDYMEHVVANPIGRWDQGSETFHMGVGAWTVLLQAAIEGHDRTVHVLFPDTMFAHRLKHHWLNSWCPTKREDAFVQPSDLQTTQSPS